MEYASYQDPKIKCVSSKKGSDKIACVITTHVSDKMRFGYPSMNEGGEVSMYTDDKLANIKFTIACYRHFKAGVPFELILVDNDTTDITANEYFDSLPYRRIKRENNGFSFGGYKHFWEHYGKEYDYFLFHEQDFCPAKDNWLKEIYDSFLSDNAIGAVGNVIEYRSIKDEPENVAIKQQFEYIKTKRDYIYNLDGAYTFTSRQVLKDVEKIGGLKVFDGTIETSTMNEIAFAQQILECGYTIASFGNRDFAKSDRIHSYGMRRGDLTRDFDENKVAPMVDTMMRKNCRQMADYFTKHGLQD